MGGRYLWLPGSKASPSACAIGSQSVKTTESGGLETINH
jgi:hypothetical protein